MGIFINVLLKTVQITLCMNAVIWVKSSRKSRQEKVMLDIIKWTYFTGEGGQKKVEFLQRSSLDFYMKTTLCQNRVT